MMTDNERTDTLKPKAAASAPLQLTFVQCRTDDEHSTAFVATLIENIWGGNRQGDIIPGGSDQQQR